MSGVFNNHRYGNFRIFDRGKTNKPGVVVPMRILGGTCFSGKIDTRDKTTAIVLSGGNVDSDLFAEIQRGASN